MVGELVWSQPKWDKGDILSITICIHGTIIEDLYKRERKFKRNPIFNNNKNTFFIKVEKK